MEVTKSIEFDAGHRVRRHGGACRSPHGHRYRVELTVAGGVHHDDAAVDGGMVVDFARIKAVLVERVHDRFDHAFLVERDDPLATVLAEPPEGEDGYKVAVVDFTPTAERLAEHIFMICQSELFPMTVEAVTVWETPTSSAHVTRHTIDP